MRPEIKPQEAYQIKAQRCPREQAVHLASYTKGPRRLCCDAPHPKDPKRICGELCKVSSIMSGHRTSEHGGTTGKPSPVVYEVNGMVFIPLKYQDKIRLRLPPNYIWGDMPEDNGSTNTSTRFQVPVIVRPSSYTLHLVLARHW